MIEIPDYDRKKEPQPGKVAKTYYEQYFINRVLYLHNVVFADTSALELQQESGITRQIIHSVDKDIWLASTSTASHIKDGVYALTVKTGADAMSFGIPIKNFYALDLLGDPFAEMIVDYFESHVEGLSAKKPTQLIIG